MYERRKKQELIPEEQSEAKSCELEVVNKFLVKRKLQVIPRYFCRLSFAGKLQEGCNL